MMRYFKVNMVRSIACIPYRYYILSVGSSTIRDDTFFSFILFVDDLYIPAIEKHTLNYWAMDVVIRYDENYDSKHII